MLRKLLLGFSLVSFFGTFILILTFHVNHRTKHLWINHPSNFSSINSHSQTIRSPQYLWCINHYGPNNQLKDFFKCSIIAMINNYTLIIPPLYPHYSDRNRGVQWFEHFYDLQKFSSAVKFIRLDEFIKEKQLNKQVSIDCYLRQIDLIKNRMWYSMNTLNSIQSYFKIQIHFQQTIDLNRKFHLKDISDSSRNCSSIFLHIHYTTFGEFFSSPNKHIQIIFEHFHRIPFIQRLTSRIIQYLPKFIQTNKTLNLLAVVHIRIGDYTVMSVSMYIQNILHLIKIGVRFTHLHIMCPYLNVSHLNELKQRLPIPFTTTKQIRSHVETIFDPYAFDIVEQELAYQAPIFIASPWTTYSATVLMQKIYQNKGIVYILSRNGKINPLLVTKKNVKYF